MVAVIEDMLAQLTRLSPQEQALLDLQVRLGAASVLDEINGTYIYLII